MRLAVFTRMPRKFVIKCGNFAVLVDLHTLPLGGQEDASWFTREHTEEVTALVRDAVDQRVRQYAEALHTRGLPKQKKELAPGKALCVRGKSFDLVANFLKRHFNLRCIVKQQYGELRVFPERYVVCVSRPENASALLGNPSLAATESNEQSRSEYFSRAGETQEPLNSSAKTKRAALQKIARLASGQRKMCGSGPGDHRPDKRPSVEEQGQKPSPEEAGPSLGEPVSTLGQSGPRPGEARSAPGEPASVPGEFVSIRGETAPSLGKTGSSPGEKVPHREEVRQVNPLPCPDPLGEPRAQVESMVESGLTLGEQTEKGFPDRIKPSETSAASSQRVLSQGTSRSKRHKPSHPEEDPLPQRAKRACLGGPSAPVASELMTQTHPVERSSQTSKRDPLPASLLPLVKPEAKAESKAFPAPESDKTTLEVELLTSGKRAQRLPLTSNNTEQTNQNRLAASLRGLSVNPASSGSSISSRSRAREEGRENVPRTSRLRRQKRS